MQVLFVHGMGRSPLSGGLLLWLLKRAGCKLRVFGYSVSFDDFAGVKARLVERISQVAALGDGRALTRRGAAAGGVKRLAARYAQGFAPVSARFAGSRGTPGGAASE